MSEADYEAALKRAMGLGLLLALAAFAAALLPFLLAALLYRGPSEGRSTVLLLPGVVAALLAFVVALPLGRRAASARRAWLPVLGGTLATSAAALLVLLAAFDVLRT